MENLPLISVIVPIYNVEAYLPRCLDSIIGQTYKNLEILLIDDGSPDSCPQICDQYAQKDARIKVIHQENKGLPGARNKGMDLMKGDFFIFVDADDWVSTDFCEKLYQQQRQTNADMVTCSYYRVSDTHTLEQPLADIDFSGYLQPAQFLFILLKHKIPFAWNKLYRRSWTKNIRFDLRYSIVEDWYFTSSLAKQGGIFAQISIPLYFYYQRPNSMLRTSNSHQWYLALRMVLGLYNQFKTSKFLPLRKELLGSLLSFAGAFSLVALLEKPKNLDKIMRARKILTTHPSELITTRIMRLPGKVFSLLLIFFPNQLRWICGFPSINSWLKRMFAKTR